ncbi:hypothetical protein NUACC21_53730 [Scytonema sp. NUACC21]
MFQAATTGGVPPLCLSFIPIHEIHDTYAMVVGAQGIAPLLFFDWLIVEILDTLLPERVTHINPKVVKKPVSKFRSKKPTHRGTGTRVEAPIFSLRWSRVRVLPLDSI